MDASFIVRRRVAGPGGIAKWSAATVANGFSDLAEAARIYADDPAGMAYAELKPACQR
jgi:hypothetical protein